MVHMLFNSVRLVNFLTLMISFGWFGTDQVFASAQSIQNVFQARPLLLRSKIITFEPYSLPLRRQRSLDAGLNLSTAVLYLIRVQEQRKSFVYKELLCISEYVQYLAHDTFQLPLTTSELDQVLQMEGVHPVAYRLPSAMKMSDEIVAVTDSNISVVSEDTFADESLLEGTFNSDERVAPEKDLNTPVTIYLVIVGSFSTQDLEYFCRGYNSSVCQVREVTPDKKLAIDTNEINKRSIMNQCSAHPLVRWVQEKSNVKFMNKFASSAIQGFIGPALEQRHPFWEKNLTGHGEIIGTSTVQLF
jgi:hypothetical protein